MRLKDSSGNRKTVLYRFGSRPLNRRFDFRRRPLSRRFGNVAFAKKVRSANSLNVAPCGLNSQAMFADRFR